MMILFRRMAGRKPCDSMLEIIRRSGLGIIRESEQSM